MQLEELREQILTLAGSVRGETFLKACDFAISFGAKHIVETGCYRGIDADGQSTLIFAKLATWLGADFVSIDNNHEHVARAHVKVGTGENWKILLGDSVAYLSRRAAPIDLLYLDSYDYVEANPLPSQLHQVAEIGAAWGMLHTPSVVLLDDCNIPGGGKGLHTSAFLLERGYKLVADKYQKVFLRQ